MLEFLCAVVLFVRIGFDFFFFFKNLSILPLKSFALLFIF